MKNTFLNKYKSSILISISGRNINRLIGRINNNKIDILNIKYISDDEAIIKIFKENYQKLEEIKTIYNINILDTSGISSLKAKSKNNRFIIISIIVGIALLIFLTNIIFNIKVIHDNPDIRTLIKNELEEYDIKKYHLVKSYDYIEKVKKEILSKYKDKIEWLEIERRGVNYYVRLELRKIPNLAKDNIKRHIVAHKDAIIKSIDASSGMIVKNINNYVKKGDIIISGNIILNDESKGFVKAEGSVFGEVWYKVVATYPFVYQERSRTGLSNKSISINFLNKKYPLFDFKKYKYKDVEEKKIMNSNFIPLSLSLDTNYEVKKIDEVLNRSEAKIRALEVARSKIESKLSANEKIISEKVLNERDFDSKIELEVFFTVYENIGEYQEIVEE